MNKLLLTITLLAMFSYNAFGAGRAPLVKLTKPTCDKIIGTKLDLKFQDTVLVSKQQIGTNRYPVISPILVTEADYAFSLDFKIVSCTIKYQVKGENTTSWSNETNIADYATCKWKCNYTDGTVVTFDNDQLLDYFSPTGMVTMTGYNAPASGTITVIAYCELEYAGEDAKYYTSGNSTSKMTFSKSQNLELGTQTSNFGIILSSTTFAKIVNNEYVMKGVFTIIRLIARK